MPNYHFMDLIKQARRLGAKDISVFGYGEPLMDKDLWQKVFYCCEMNTHITTNAGLLDRDTSFALLNSGLKNMRFSAHGIGHNYEKVHKKLNWGTFVTNAFGFIKINDERCNHSCTTDVSVIPMHGESIEEIRDFWESEVDYLEIWKPHNWTDGKGFRKVNHKKKTCGRPFRGPVQINADGKVMVCCFDFDAKLIVGDTYKNSIEEILKGDRFNDIREAHMTGKLDGLICQTCDQLNIEDESPLLYSNRDTACSVGKTSSTKFKIEV